MRSATMVGPERPRRKKQPRPKREESNEKEKISRSRWISACIVICSFPGRAAWLRDLRTPRTNAGRPRLVLLLLHLACKAKCNHGRPA